MKNRFSVKSTDIICICSNNHLDSCVPFISTCFVGSITASLDPTLSLADTVHLIKQVTPKMIFVIPEAVQLIEDALDSVQLDSAVIVFGPTVKHIPFATFLEEKEGEDSFTPFQVDDIKDTAAIFFSSGTTGFPKGICVSHCALFLQARALA